MNLNNGIRMLPEFLGMGLDYTNLKMKNWLGKDAPTYPYKNSMYTACKWSTLTSNLAQASQLQNQYKATSAGQNTWWYGVSFGTGTTPVTPTDYKLSGEPILGLSSSNVTVGTTYEHNDDYMKMTVTYTINNTTGADITIGEIGIWNCIKSYKDSSNTNYSDYWRYEPILVDRVVLDSPVTIPSTGVGQVVYEVQLDFPTA